jgi:hemolysin-activating ACP:hemolysin acyltransferase
MDICSPTDIDMGLSLCLQICAHDDNWMRRSVLDVHLYITNPLRTGNILVAWDDERPVGWLSFAYFNEETAARFKDGQIIDPEEWNSGQDFWVIDFVTANTNGRDVMLAVKDLLPDGMRVNWWRGKNDQFHEKVVRH